MSTENITVVSADYVMSVTQAGQLHTLPAPDVREIAFAGRSNVGKSSLINVLVQRKGLVRTSSTPGSTRALNLFRLSFKSSLGQGTLQLMDLPGYGFAHRSRQERQQWQSLIERYLKARVNLSAVVVIVDIRRGLEPDDQQLIDYLHSMHKRVIPVATKLDKVPLNQRKVALSKLSKASQVRWIGFSATAKEAQQEGFLSIWKKMLS